MILGSVLYFVAGLFLGNGIPHYVKGIAGYRHQTPFKKPSSAVVNVLWGTLNGFIGFWIAVGAASFEVPVPLAGTSLLVGMGLFGWLMALHWQNDPEARGESVHSTENNEQRRSHGSDNMG